MEEQYMRRIRLIAISVLALGIGYATGKGHGAHLKQKEIVDRVLRTPEKECYTETELEIMLFGEPQL